MEIFSSNPSLSFTIVESPRPFVNNDWMFEEKRPIIARVEEYLKEGVNRALFALLPNLWRGIEKFKTDHRAFEKKPKEVIYDSRPRVWSV